MPMFLPYEEAHALQLILRHYGITDEALIKDLSSFCCWIHDEERASHDPGQPKPPFLLVLLSQLGLLHKRCAKADVLEPAA
jgi:hypothetical protein